MIWRIRWYLGIALALIATLGSVVAVLIGGGVASEGPPTTETTSSVSGSGVIGGQPDFSFAVAAWEAYWFSRFNLGTLVMMSGLGETFDPDPAAIEAAVRAVDANPDDGDTVPPFANLALLRSVFASADPSLVVDISQVPKGDLSAFRLDPASFDTTVTTRAMAQTLIKEVEWAKAFHIPFHFGTPSDDFGALERFKGMAMFMLASMQADYAIENLQQPNGLYADSNGTVDRIGNWNLLQAFSDLSGLAGDSSKRYFNEELAQKYDTAAQGLFEALRGQTPQDIPELSAALQALTWHAANTSSDELRAKALADIASFGDALLELDADSPVERADAIRGLVEAGRISGEQRFMDRVAELFDELASDFDPDHGLFQSQDTYTANDLAIILGGLNAAANHSNGTIDRDEGNAMLTAFFEGSIDLSGLVQAALPGKAEGEAGAFEQNLPSDLFYRYPTVPVPPEAGGEFGKAPVFASEVRWDGSEWTVTNDRVTPAWEMHLSNEMLWLGILGVNGFPEVSG